MSRPELRHVNTKRVHGLDYYYVAWTSITAGVHEIYPETNTKAGQVGLPEFLEVFFRDAHECGDFVASDVRLPGKDVVVELGRARFGQTHAAVNRVVEVAVACANVEDRPVLRDVDLLLFDFFCTLRTSFCFRFTRWGLGMLRVGSRNPRSGGK